MSNLWIQVTRYREAIVTETTKWYDFEDRRKEIVNTCPERTFECLNACADNSARDVDCNCPPFDQIAHPACPTSLCADGSERDPVDCDCPNEMPVLEVAEPVVEAVEPVVEAVEPVVEVALNAPSDVELDICEDNMSIKW